MADKYCVDCESFHVAYYPIKDWDWGRAVCEKHDLVADFPSSGKLAKLKCVEKEDKALMDKVWVVSWCDDGQVPTVTVFNNKKAADALLMNNIDKYDHICIDQCEVYSKFKIDGKVYGQ